MLTAIYTYPCPLCLQDPHEAWSPVRDAHTLSSLPTRPARGVVADARPLSSPPTRPARSVVASQRRTPPCLQDPHEAWSPVRDTRPLSSPPTRPARSVVVGQRHTPPLLSAYKTRTKRGRRSETHTPLHLPAYKTRTKRRRRSETHTPSPLCLQDPHKAWSPVRDTHTLSSLPRRPARSVVAGQRHTPPLLSAYKNRTKRGRRSETHIQANTLSSLVTRPTQIML